MSAPEPHVDEALEWHCYRHPDRVAGVRCLRCDRAICPDCMVTAPVGFQCPECVRAAPPVRTFRTMRSVSTNPVVAVGLIAVNVVAFVLGSGRPGFELDYALFGPAVAVGEWWRIVTSGFLHAGVLHLGMNMFLLYQLGTMLEPALGRARFAALYAMALLAGSLGVLLVDPDALTLGASGAVFGLMGAAVLELRRRGVPPMQSGLGGLLLVNLVITFLVPGISIGGHVGGLVGGAVGSQLLAFLDDRPALGAGVVGAAAVALGAACLSVAGSGI